MTTPYFYIIKHKSTGKRYAGSRWAIGCHPSELLTEDGYITSSSRIQRIIMNEGLSSFEIEEIIELDDPYLYETEFLIKNSCAESDVWFNTHNNENKPAPYGSEQFKEMMLSKYGVTHNTMIPEVKTKMIESAKSTYRNSPEMLKKRALKIAEKKRINGTTGKGMPKKYTNNGLTGKWERSSDWCQSVAHRQKEKSTFVINNPMNDLEKRKLVSLSKIGKKKFMNIETREVKMFFPGSEPDGFIKFDRKKFDAP